jgi:hypothetical protein
MLNDECDRQLRINLMIGTLRNRQNTIPLPAYAAG